MRGWRQEFHSPIERPSEIAASSTGNHGGPRLPEYAGRQLCVAGPERSSKRGCAIPAYPARVGSTSRITQSARERICSPPPIEGRDDDGAQKEGDRGQTGEGKCTISAGRSGGPGAGLGRKVGTPPPARARPGASNSH